MQRSVSRFVGILFGALAGLLGAASCGSSGGSEPEALSNADASYCEPGTLGCFCDGAGNCDVGLVCDVGRCLGSEGDPQTLDPPTTIQGAPVPGSGAVLDAGNAANAPRRDAADSSDAGDAGANGTGDTGADASSGSRGPA